MYYEVVVTRHDNIRKRDIEYSAGTFPGTEKGYNDAVYAKAKVMEGRAEIIERDYGI